VAGMWAVFDSFCLKGRLQMRSQLTHFQSTQSGQSSCFHQAAAALPYSCNSVWWSLPPARCGNSILSTSLTLTRPAQGSTTGPILGGWLVAPLLLSAFVPHHTSARC
jgi:hypothetical protein